MNLKTNQKGFTIVELLIVIVVIAILAAISIVAFTGVQDRAKTSSGSSLASQVEKKAQAFYTINSRYPDDFADFNSTTESALEGIAEIQLIVGFDVTSTTHQNGKGVSYKPCGTPGSRTGATVGYWDFTGTAQMRTRTVGTC